LDIVRAGRTAGESQVNVGTKAGADGGKIHSCFVKVMVPLVAKGAIFELAKFSRKFTVMDIPDSFKSAAVDDDRARLGLPPVRQATVHVLG
jgi:hypothetical protein